MCGTVPSMFGLPHLYTSFPTGKLYQETILSLPVPIPQHSVWQNPEARPKHLEEFKEMEDSVQN